MKSYRKEKYYKNPCNVSYQRNKTDNEINCTRIVAIVIVICLKITITTNVRVNIKDNGINILNSWQNRKRGSRQIPIVSMIMNEEDSYCCLQALKSPCLSLQSTYQQDPEMNHVLPVVNQIKNLNKSIHLYQPELTQM